MSETTIRTTMGFVLPCRVCGTEILVGPTKEFVEAITGADRVAYFAPDAEAGDRPIGYGSGTGESFACKWCHAAEWAEAAKKESP